MWQPDGWGDRARIGILTPDTDVVPESEFSAMAPQGVSVHATRVPFHGRTAAGLEEPIALAGVRAFAESPRLDEAAERLAAAPLDAITYAFTSSSYLGGAGEDGALRARLEKKTHGIPVVTACAAALAALKALDARRLTIVSPPWFSETLTQKAAEFFTRHKFEVLFTGAMPLKGAPDVAPGLVYAWVRRNIPPRADAVFIGGNGFRAIGAIQALEEDLRRPIVTANQGLFWCALRRAGVRATVSGYGQLFAAELREDDR